MRRIGKDAEALPKFEKAYGKSKNAKHLAQMGLCLQAVGRWSEAEEALSTALQEGSNAWIKSNRDVIKDSLETVKQHVGSLELGGSPEGASVVIDGRAMGTLPLSAPLRLNEGPLVLEVRAPNHRPERQELVIHGGQFRRLQVDLRSEAVVVPGFKPTAEREASSVSVATSAEETPEASDRGNGRTWLWVGAGALAVAAGVVAFLLLSSGSENPDVDGMGKL